MFRFREITMQDAKKIWDWRRKRRVSDCMATDLPGDFLQHKYWLETSFDKTHYYHWIIQAGDVDIGCVNLCDYAPDHRLTYWGFYIGEDEYVGLGGLIPPYLYNWIFDTTPIQKIEAEVLESNARVIDLHKYHGYLMAPFFDREIEKNGEKKMLKYMFLDKYIWQDKKEFQRFRADFPTQNWKGRIK